MARCVAVVGPGEGATPEDRDDARLVGELLARAGVVVVTGGLGGVMDAAAEGASAAAGLSIGILPGSDHVGASSHLTVAVPTGLGELRNGLVVRSADAVVAIGCSWGTLSEVALAMRAGIPVVCLRCWSVAEADGTPVMLDRADSASQAVERVLGSLTPPG
jgi:hypothetical protein